MVTLVKFLKHKDDNNSYDIYAYFPQLNYNEQLYGNQQKVSYALGEGHGSCCIDYAQESTLAHPNEYKCLLDELISQGYNNLEIINESFVTKQFENAYNIMYDTLIKEKLDFTTFTNKLDRWVEINAPKYGILNSRG